MDFAAPDSDRREERRIAVIADIHANMDAFRAVLADIEIQGVDRIACLGDCVGYGAEPAAVVHQVAALGCPTVMGNHELALRYPKLLDWFNPLARRSLEITRAIMDDESRRWIGTLPTAIRLWGARFVHGLPPASPMRYLFQASSDQLRRRMQAMSERLCFVGHTHQLQLVRADDLGIRRLELDRAPVALEPGLRYIVNVGSVGQPRDGTPEAKYVIWDRERKRLTLRCVPYPYRAAADKILRAGMPAAHASRLLP
jgi:diadenosine tetraphosphatase ApaH/serine/threonine PP2A family protein phosphatase